jgi:nucleoside diphosphate kinase
VVVEDARPREIPEPEIERPFGEPEITPTLLLNVVQSVPVSAPVVVELAFQIENTPVVLLYTSGQTAERDVREILVATTPERDARLAFVRARFHERVFTLPESVFTVVVKVARLPERVAIFAVLAAVCPERVAILPVAVARLELIVTSCHVIVAMLEFVVERFVWRVDTIPESVFTRHEKVFTKPEREARLVFVRARLPERVETFPERVLMFIVFMAVCPESVAMFPVAVAIFELIVTS